MNAISPSQRLLIGLDFDGVLHPFFPNPDFTDAQNQRFSMLPRFEEWLRAHPHADVVITSTWRKDRTLEQLQQFFSPELRDRIVGKTPVLPNSHEPGGRQEELEVWLQQEGNRWASWIGLDDMDMMYCPGACVVITHDKFEDREYDLLSLAAQDPQAFAVSHPVKPYGMKEKLWIPGGP